MFPALEGIFFTPGGGGGSLSVTSDSATPWTAARRASLAFTISQRDCVPTGPHLAEVAQSCPVPTDPPPHPWTLSRLLCHLLLAFGWFFTHSHSYYLPGPGDTRFCSAGSDPLLSRVGSGCEAPAVHCSGLPLTLQLTCHCIKLLGLSALQTFFPSMRVADFIKVHSTFSQGGWSLRREESALQACCRQYRKCSIKKEHLLRG